MVPPNCDTGADRQEGRAMALKKVSIGLRTVKTAAAILAAMVIVDQFGATSSRLIFAIL